ncbi:DUF1707 SHOCT-like domain-containing protein [Glycomyces tenuis]|uniref:DUF1707 SHOCT-like domain-containing protein n=1 Tax=Glycomyces tenuis TaxID=58116 RepID=UPI0003F91640|nr:DUF1707 domain-containing protein [Glycomyces tenuis]
MSAIEPYRDRSLRIGDAERTSLSELLRSSVDRGYLTLEEYEKRVGVLMEAKTIGEAEEVLGDLPAYQQIIESQEPKLEPLGTPPWVKWLWFGVSIPIGINVGVWLILEATVGSIYFWPVWVLVPLLVVAGALTVAERTIMRPAEEKKRQERVQRKKYRR